MIFDLAKDYLLSKYLFVCTLCFSVVLGLPESVHSQIKYTPDHPTVRAMCDSAFKFVEFSTRDTKHGALSALAVVQYYKRYEQRVPKGNKYVNDVISGILSEFPEEAADYSEIENDRNILVQQELYYPCLALILLAEYDSKEYAPEIKRLLKMLKNRQRPNGAFTYRSQPNSGDTSQTQFAALAMSVAKTHGFNVDVQMAKKTLEWFCASQQGGGQWLYKLVYGAGSGGPGQIPPANQANNTPGLSMQAAGLGSCYLLADFLQLNKRAKSMNKISGKDTGLPRTVTVYVKPIDGENPLNKSGPLTNFDRGKLNSATGSGNKNLIANFKPKNDRWNYYYLYAIERYAYFREQSEGDMRGLEDWYDQVIEQFKADQNSDGSFPQGPAKLEGKTDATAFALLFMVRSSEVINLPIVKGPMDGDIGFKKDAVLVQDDRGRVKSVDAEKNLGDLLEMLKDGANDEQMRELSNSLKKQIVEFRKKGDKDRGQIKAFLRSMIGAKNYFRRLIAVRFLAGEQDMDNAPALIYALGDPDFRIALEAHNGLRLISRKIDSLKISATTQKNAVRDSSVLSQEEKNSMMLEFGSVKTKWTDWFLKIRPGAELLD